MELVGEKLGPYRVLRSIGTGGMGHVYEAEDTRLGRRIALKVLPGEMAEDFERRQRFEREARAIAALDHPNIVAIHSIEECDGIHFMTMALVEGRTLAELIPEGGFPIERLLELAVRIVEAVAATHQKGVVHRDLKPTNVMVSDDGRVRLLDFGLATLREEPGMLMSDSAFGTLQLTGEGQVIGTVAYMSPEQAQGRPADQRSDVFSLGVLLYEMASGKPPFQGDSPISVLSSILRDTPRPISEVRPVLPPQLGRIVRICLAKNPLRRFQTAIDLRNALDDLKLELQSGEVEGGGPRPTAAGQAAAAGPSPSVLQVGGALLAVLAAGIAGGLIGWLSAPRASLAPPGGPRSDEPEPHSYAIITDRLTTEAGVAGSASWFPDGQAVVYASDAAGSMDLWRRPAGGGPATRLTMSDDEDEDHPDVSPGGDRVAYWVDSVAGGVRITTPTAGGGVDVVTDFGARPKWSPLEGDERIVFDWQGSIWLVETDDRRPRLIVDRTSAIPWVTWSHDAERLYFWNRKLGVVQVVDPEAPDDGAVSLDLVPTGEEVAGLAAAPDGRALVMSRGPFGGNKNLWWVPLDPATGMPSRTPAMMTAPLTDDRDPAFSRDGLSMTFSARRVVRHLWSGRIDAATGRLDGEPIQITFDHERNYYPSLSADETLLAFTSHITEQGLVFQRHLDHPDEEWKATPDWEGGVREISPSFSPGASEMVFASTRGGFYELWYIRCAAGNLCPPVRLTESAGARDAHPAWAPASARIAFNSNRDSDQAGRGRAVPGNDWNIWLLDREGQPSLQPLTTDPSDELYPVWSPDGTLIAFTSDRDRSLDIWVMAADGSDPRPLVSHPADDAWGGWDAAGRWFYFVSDRGGAFNLWVTDASGAGEALPVTDFAGRSRGLPEDPVYTKFAVGRTRVVLPVEERSASIYRMDLSGEAR